MDKEEILQDSINSLMFTSMHVFMRQLHLYSKQQNLSVSQMNCLFKMHKVGSFQVNQISKFFDISKPAASQLLDKLVQRGLVLREEDPNDRRVKNHSLTPKGEKLIHVFFMKMKEISLSVVKKIEISEYDQNIKMLEKITNELSNIIKIENKENKC